jgi:hypothetical protein
MNTFVSKRIRSGFVAGCLAASMLPVTAYSAVEADKFWLLAKNASKRPATSGRAAAQTMALRSPAEVAVVTSLAGEAGYVHYFVITGPDGEPETQVGIELEDGRIAWSFPEAGVFVAPFMAAGSVSIGNSRYEVEHLYGLRPFRDPASMRALGRELTARIAPYLDDQTPYCDESGNTDRFCLSCLGFVLRVLYPGDTRAFPALPSDFRAARKTLYSTEDLLLYLTGIPVEGPRAARVRRIEALVVPDPLREELTRISAGLDQIAPPVAAAKPRRATARPRAAAQPVDTTRRAPGRRS